MSNCPESRFALYEGLIAIAWVDGHLEGAEQAILKDIFANNVDLTGDQRTQLEAEITTPKSLSDIWPRITSPQDRARLLDLADLVFKSDGGVDETEQRLYAAKLAKHLRTVNVDAIEDEIAALRAQQSETDRRTSQEDRQYARQFGIFGFIKRVVGQNTDPHNDQRSA